MRSALRDPRVRAVWLAETLNAFGSGLTFWALAWLLYRHFPAQPLASASALTVLSVASLGGAFTLGAALDAWNRRRVLVIVNALLAVLTALLPLVTRPGVGLLALYALLAVIGVARSLPKPALSASLVAWAPAGQLARWQALFNLTWMIGELLAPVAAGFLISALGAAPVLWLDAVTYAVVALVYGAVRFPSGQTGPVRRLVGWGWWTEAREGWQVVMGRPALWGSFLGVGAANGFFETFGALFLPRIGQRLLGGVNGPAGAGVLDAVSVGAEMLAALWLARQSVPPRALRPLVALGCALPVVFAVGIVLAPNYPLALALSVLNGVVFAPLSVLQGVLVARQAPASALGRVNSAGFLLGNVSRPLFMTAAGALLPALGLGPLALGLGGLALLLTALGYRRDPSA